MLKQILKFRSVLVLMIGLSFLYLGTFAQADDNQSNQGGSYGNRYHFRNGHWYGPGEVPVSHLSVGAIVEALPPQHTTIVVENIPYYYDNILYYKQMPDNTYVVVSAPLIH